MKILKYYMLICLLTLLANVTSAFGQNPNYPYDIKIQRVDTLGEKQQHIIYYFNLYDSIHGNTMSCMLGGSVRLYGQTAFDDPWEFSGLCICDIKSTTGRGYFPDSLYVDFTHNGVNNGWYKTTIGLEYDNGTIENCPDTIFIGKCEKIFINPDYYLNLKAICVDPENPNYKDINGVLYRKDGKELLCVPHLWAQDKVIENLVPDLVPDSAFLGSYSIGDYKTKTRIRFNRFPKIYFEPRKDYVDFGMAVLYRTPVFPDTLFIPSHLRMSFQSLGIRHKDEKVNLKNVYLFGPDAHMGSWIQYDVDDPFFKVNPHTYVEIDTVIFDESTKYVIPMEFKKTIDELRNKVPVSDDDIWGDNYCNASVVICKSPTPPRVLNYCDESVGMGPFPCMFGNMATSTVLYVPKGSKKAYSTAHGWCYFYRIEELDENGNIVPTDIDTLTKQNVKVYSENGFVNVDNITDVSHISAYTVNGQRLQPQKVDGSRLRFKCNAGDLVIVKTDSEVRKILVK